MFIYRHRLVLAVAGTLLVAGCASDQETGSSTGGQGQQGGSGTGIATTVGADARQRLEAIGDRVFFDYQQAELQPEGRALVQKWAGWLEQYPTARVTIEGHCDERGTREYNLALGERRAEAAKSYLLSLGVDARRISVVSYGKERPAVVGSAEDAWSKNRRAVMVPD